MFGFLLLLALLPILEVMVLIKMGQAFGFRQTILMLIGVGFLGSVLMRLEGLRVLFNIQTAMNSGEMPAEPMIDGLFIFLAGILLVVPGLLSDIAALALLLPPTRFLLKTWMKSRIDRAFSTARTQGQTFHYRFLIQD